jgi:RimJ/RimL family protein N-acetyltransferase
MVDDRHLGNAGLLIDRDHSEAELWLYLGEGRGAGVGRRAADALLGRAFDSLGLDRAAVRVVSDNEGGLRFWRSLGFVETGSLREDAGHENSVWLGLLRWEWESWRA